MTELEAFHAEKDRFFGAHPQSPLTTEQRRQFRGLRYFPENPALRLKVTVELFARQDTIHMPTTAGGAQPYTRYGRFRFTVGGEKPNSPFTPGRMATFCPL